MNYNTKMTNINNRLTIIKDENETNDLCITLVIKDLERKGNDNNVRHCIKISVDGLKNGKIKIPSVIKVRTWILNHKEDKNAIEMQQVCDKLRIIYNNSVWNDKILDANDFFEEDIMEIITTFLNSLNGLENDEYFQMGFSIIKKELLNAIGILLESWRNFDIDTYIGEQKNLIKLYEMEYLTKINPIKKEIELLEYIKNEKNKSK